VHIAAPPASEVTATQQPVPPHSSGLNQPTPQHGTCRGFLAYPAPTRLRLAAAVLNVQRRAAGRGPAPTQLLSAFTRAAETACTRQPSQSWALVMTQLYSNRPRTYDR
jgi:hypothetical protein